MTRAAGLAGFRSGQRTYHVRNRFSAHLIKEFCILCRILFYIVQEKRYGYQAGWQQKPWLRMGKELGNLKSITVEAKIENVDKVTEFVNEVLEEKECPLKVQMQLDVAIDEIFGNIAYYAYGKGSGNATIQIEMEDNPPKITLIFIDQGIPYNPLENKDPDITLDIEDREIGGLGIFLVKKTMDELSYEYVDGQNILTMKKELV